MELRILGLHKREKACVAQPALQGDDLMVVLEAHPKHLRVVHVDDPHVEDDEDVGALHLVLEVADQAPHVARPQVEAVRDGTQCRDLVRRIAVGGIHFEEKRLPQAVAQNLNSSLGPLVADVVKLELAVLRQLPLGDGAVKIAELAALEKLVPDVRAVATMGGVLSRALLVHRCLPTVNEEQPLSHCIVAAVGQVELVMPGWVVDVKVDEVHHLLVRLREVRDSPEQHAAQVMRRRPTWDTWQQALHQPGGMHRGERAHVLQVRQRDHEVLRQRIDVDLLCMVVAFEHRVAPEKGDHLPNPRLELHLRTIVVQEADEVVSLQTAFGAHETLQNGPLDREHDAEVTLPRHLPHADAVLAWVSPCDHLSLDLVRRLVEGLSSR
mmetsp:Transcript_105871/g.306222  ORF Transcript_105871/g.306222 Transcript_105871/m.306222 type:complete len:381 (-) Transcript_105871:1665-2807(-)